MQFLYKSCIEQLYDWGSVSGSRFLQNHDVVFEAAALACGLLVSSQFCKHGVLEHLERVCIGELTCECFARVAWKGERKQNGDRQIRDLSNRQKERQTEDLQSTRLIRK